MAADPSHGSAARKQASEGSEALQKLRGGQLTLDEYIDLKVDAALGGLGRLVTEKQREDLREVVREQVAVDPVVQQYLRLALGSAKPGEPR